MELDMSTSQTSTTEQPNCAAKAGQKVGQIVPMLVWSGLGLCAAVATFYDLRDIVGW
jgi:hypothetical protein